MVAVESTFESIPSFFSSGGKGFQSSASFSPNSGHRSSWSFSGGSDGNGNWRREGGSTGEDKKNYTGAEEEKRTLLDINNSTIGMPTGALVGGSASASSSSSSTSASSPPSPPLVATAADVPLNQDTNQVGFFGNATNKYLTIGGSILGVTFLVVAVVVMTVMTKRSKRASENTLAPMKRAPPINENHDDALAVGASSSELCDKSTFDEDAKAIPPLSRYLTIKIFKDTDEQAKVNSMGVNNVGGGGGGEGREVIERQQDALHPIYHHHSGNNFLGSKSSVNRPYQLDESLARTSQSFSNYFTSFLTPSSGGGGENDPSALKHERVIETTSPYGAPRRISRAASRYYAVNEQQQQPLPRDSICSVIDVPMNYAVRRISEEPSAKRSLRVMNRTTTIVD